MASFGSATGAAPAARRRLLAPGSAHCAASLDPPPNVSCCASSPPSSPLLASSADASPSSRPALPAAFAEDAAPAKAPPGAHTRSVTPPYIGWLPPSVWSQKTLAVRWCCPLPWCRDQQASAEWSSVLAAVKGSWCQHSCNLLQTLKTRKSLYTQQVSNSSRSSDPPTAPNTMKRRQRARLSLSARASVPRARRALPRPQKRRSGRWPGTPRTRRRCCPRRRRGHPLRHRSGRQQRRSGRVRAHAHGAALGRARGPSRGP